MIGGGAMWKTQTNRPPDCHKQGYKGGHRQIPYNWIEGKNHGKSVHPLHIYCYRL